MDKEDIIIPTAQTRIKKIGWLYEKPKENNEINIIINLINADDNVEVVDTNDLVGEQDNYTVYVDKKGVTKG